MIIFRTVATPIAEEYGAPRLYGLAQTIDDGAHVGDYADMGETVLLFRHRQDFDDGAILEPIVWKLAGPIAGSAHPYKYRLFCGYKGERVMGYDNERSIGDHRHYRRRESAYSFVSPERLIDDFLADVALERSRS